MKYNYNSQREQFHINATNKRIGEFKALSEHLTLLGIEFNPNDLYVAPMATINKGIKDKYQSLFIDSELNEIIERVGLKTRYHELKRLASTFKDKANFQFNPETFEHYTPDFCHYAETKEQQTELKKVNKLIKELESFGGYNTSQLVQAFKGVFLLDNSMKLIPNPRYINRIK